MTIAVVFDSAGTLLRTYRAVKDIKHGDLLTDVETTNLTFADEHRALIVLHVSSREIIAANKELLLSTYLNEHDIGFGIACSCQVVPAENIGKVLSGDRTAVIGDLQECIRNVWRMCREKPLVAIDSGVILHMGQESIEFTVTSGGSPFEGARETITDLHRMGVATFIASGDREAKLEKMADYLGIPRDHVYGFATPTIKAQIVEDLKAAFDVVVMVGDAINDLHAMKKADVAILTEQQHLSRKPDVLVLSADYVIHRVDEVVGIVRQLCESCI